MRLLSEWPGEGTRQIEELFPEVEVVEVPLSGMTSPAGDALPAVPALHHRPAGRRGGGQLGTA
jgi:hypothetical protein